MSSTNKTSNYQLTQFVGTDQPSWLGDYNSDMNKIDTQMKNNADEITTVAAQITTASATASNAHETAEEALTTAETAQSVANTANATANSASTNASNALNTATTAQNTANNATTAIEKFNLQTFSPVYFTASNANILAGNETLNSATNADGSIGKLYGRLVFTTTSSSPVILTAQYTYFRPESTININGIALFNYSDTSGNLNMNMVSVTIASDGKITITLPSIPNGTTVRLFSIASLLFLKDFGDLSE